MSEAAHMPQYRKVMCYGVCGSGKTTLATRLSQVTGVPWHSADDLTWLPNWQMAPDDVQTTKITEVVTQDSWILDTAYGKWIEVPMAHVELIVALDYSRWLSLCRLVKRSVQRAIDKQPVCNGNIESWRNMFSRESIVLWHFRSFGRKRERIREWQNTDNGPRIVVFKSPKACEEWLKSQPLGLGFVTIQ